MTDKFWKKVNSAENGCLIWTASKVNGYGRFKVPGENRTEYAHRYAWYLATGTYPIRGMHIDHLCRNVSCVNVSHLEIVPPKVNQNRGLSGPKIVCPKGHPRFPGNVRFGSEGGRHCRICDKKPRGKIKPHLTAEQDRQIRELSLSGMSHKAIGDIVGCSRMSVTRRAK